MVTLPRQVSDAVQVAKNLKSTAAGQEEEGLADATVRFLSHAQEAAKRMVLMFRLPVEELPPFMPVKATTCVLLPFALAPGRVGAESGHKAF